MKESEIPAFVESIIEAGCDICAIGRRHYVLGDIEEMHAAANELQRIHERFGERDPLRYEIAAYLRSLGRYLDPDSDAMHWSDNRPLQ
jgi:hypothetical protein